MFKKCSLSESYSSTKSNSLLSAVAMMITDHRNSLLQQFLETGWIPFTSVIAGIFACKLVYGISQSVSAICFNTYASLPKMNKTEWNNRAMSTVHAIFITAFSIYLAFWSHLFADDRLRGSVLLRHSSLSTFVLGVSVGYFISDLAMILWFYPSIGGIEYMIHHFLSMAALGYAMLTRLGQFYAYMVLLSEATTPGINLRWYLDAVGKKKSKTYVVNGVAIFLTWLVARILLFIYVFYHIYAHYGQLKLMPTFGFYLVSIGPCVLAVLNLTWFAKITEGMIKTIRSKKD